MCASISDVAKRFSNIETGETSIETSAQGSPHRGIGIQANLYSQTRCGRFLLIFIFISYFPIFFMIFFMIYDCVKFGLPTTKIPGRGSHLGKKTRYVHSED